ncbi:TetR family transcriptional regulator [Dietzia kunjamensis]|uniref:TetR/AcrR family transcriptional regulator n=1 Tax=Dietzia TaxID=37914 RepID=UPI000BDEBDBD|nr:MULTISPECIES: TetR/AcrR family transcriptional regulator [Dietzia]RKE62450.1 TetR family transcriptional regulator [Dietzia kunjamensis]USX45648.1 TetR/AcrR family transcriptional regulator [Dietzia kunjamensis]
MTISAPSRHTTRDRALTAARAAILEIGPSRTTMVEVSRRSGVGRTTLYRHWPDISALVADLLTRELTGVVERVGPDLLEGAVHDADELARLLCAMADEVRTDPLLDALRRHESGMLAEYVFRRLGTSQHRLIDFLRDVLARAIAADARLAGRDPDRMATMLYLAVQAAVLSAPLADPPLDADSWRAELHLLVTGYLGL